MKTNIRQNRAITLIALVITIIVLLILVGVTIATLTGDNGLLTRASQAQIKTAMAEAKEQCDLIALGEVSKYYGGTQADGLDTAIVTKLNEKVGENKLANGVTASLNGTGTNAKITLTSNKGETERVVGTVQNGKIIWKDMPNREDGQWLIGDETKKKIYTIEDLVELSNRTNNGESFEGETIELMSDLDFNDVTCYENADRTDFGDINGNETIETLKTELTTEQGFMPIGRTSALALKATFDGKNHTIKNLHIDRTTSYSALIGNSYTIQNLTVKDGYVSGGWNTAGIVGALRSGKIEKCHNNNTTVILREGDFCYVGGIVGVCYSGTDEIVSCTNTGDISAYSTYGNGLNYLRWHSWSLTK